MKVDSVVLWKYVLVVLGVFCVGAAKVSMLVKEGESVTLQTGVKADQQDKIKWFFNNIRIAQISGDHSKICTDVQCNNGTERYRDRLKLDHQTGSLTIMNIRTTDSGEYHLEIINTGKDNETIFNVTVHGISAAERDEMKRTSVEKEESDPGLSLAAKAGICVAVFLLLVAAALAGVIHYRRNCQAGQNGTGTRMQNSYQVTDANEMPHNGNANARETSV